MTIDTPDSMPFTQRRQKSRASRDALVAIALFLWAAVFSASSHAEPIRYITVDGDFSDWASVATYTDPDGGPGVMHHGVPDVHDTDSRALGSIPRYVDHSDVDILEYKFTHDENNLYGYFKADGVIGNTQSSSQGNAGRYYVIITIDVDNDDSTGYFLHEGGYYPTSGTDRYDMNMEAEFYDGSLNTAHYLSHDAANDVELRQDFRNLAGPTYRGHPGPYTPGFVQPAPGTYNEYTQWVYQADDTITIVEDRGPIYPSIMSVALSPDGHELEISAPFKGFLKDASGNPNMALGKTIDVSFSLEASGELAPGNAWASDTADPIVGYFLGNAPVPEPSTTCLAGLAAAFFAFASRRAASELQTRR